MAYDGSNGNHSGKGEGRVESRKQAPDSAWVWRVSGLTRDGTTEPNSQDQTLWRKTRQGGFIFPVQLNKRRIRSHTRLMPSLLKVMTTQPHLKLFQGNIFKTENVLIFI